MIFLKNWPVN